MEQLERLLALVKLELSHLPNLQEFKIGKTTEPEERVKNYDGYNYFNVIATGGSDMINHAEIYLIENLREDSRCLNINNGGGGNPNADKLYLIARYEPNSIEELQEDAIMVKGLPVTL